MKPNLKIPSGVEIKVIVLSLLFCSLVIVANALLDTLSNHESNVWRLLFINVPVHEYFIRLVLLVSILAFGILVSRFSTNRDRTDRAHSRNEREFAAMLNSTGDAIIAADSDGRVTFMNPVAQDLTGWAESDALGRPLDRVFNIFDEFTGKRAGDSKKGVSRKVEKSELTNSTILKKRDGGVIAIEHKDSPIIDDSGNPLGNVTIFRDVVEKRNTEFALRTSAETARALLNAPPDTSMLLDIDGKILALNEAAAMSIQDQPEILIGNCVYDYFPPELAASRKAYADKVFKTGKPVRFEDERSGLVYDNTLYPVFDARGEIDKIAVFAADITERKKAEKALTDSEVKFRNVVDSSPMGMHFYRLEPDGRMIFEGANPAADKLLGVKNSQFIGKTIEEAFPGSVGTEIPERYRAAAEKGITWQSEQVDYVDEHIRGAFQVVAFQTTRNRMVASFFDITARKIVEKELKESEERFRSTFEQAAVGIAHVTPTGDFIRINQRFCDLVGYTRDELLQRNFQDITHPDDLKRDVGFLRQILAGELAILSAEKRYIRRDGSVADVNLTTTLLRDSDNEPKYFISVIEDITERKRAEEILKESEEKFRNVAEQSPNMIFINKRGRVVFVNKKCEEIMGYTKDEFLSPEFDFLSIIAPDYLQKIKTDFERHLKGEEVGSYEYALITKNGRRINSIINTKLIKYGGESSILGIVTDITERKKAEELRENLISDLQKAANEIKTLSGLIPICAACKKIRDDKGYWEQIETYIMERSDAEFSHGLCPECSKKLYPDL